MPIRVRSPLVALALLISGLALSAQDSTWNPELKMHWGWAGSTRDHLHPWTWGFGAGAAFDTTVGRASFELGFYQKGGDPYLQWPGDPVNGKNGSDVARSVDSRAVSVSGLFLRAALGRRLQDWGCSWKAGVMIGGSTSRFNVNGDVASKGWFDAPLGSSTKPGSTDPSLWRDTYNGSRAEWYRGVSPFAGLEFEVTPKSCLELNLLLYNFKALEYVHRYGGATAYTAQKDVYGRYLRAPISNHNDFPEDRYEASRRMVPHLEVAYVFRF